MKLLVAFSFFVFLLVAQAEKAPIGMLEFNKICPAPKLCAELDQSLAGCQQKKPKACSEFLATYEKLLPTYDCQRSFDSAPQIKHVVPAIWLCGASHEPALRFLSKQRSLAARKLFASPELRKTLDGALAEEFSDFSLKAEKRLKNQ